ncbi:hypothetical protein BKA69DRAFT_1122145 [Paraphysoderma sedebokerense]|nr:hypothetical protein BKA69DRAFT_1122145 [Paraphysoderma sedebokerense]
MSTILCQEAEIKGNISLGVGTVVHPKCRIISTKGGPILIGRNNIFEEGATIINNSTSGMVIGDENLFEVDVAGKYVGHHNIIEPKAYVSENTTIGDNCVIGTACTTARNEVIPNDTVIFGGDNMKTKVGGFGTLGGGANNESRESENVLHARHLDYLREVLPKYNHTKAL